MKRTLSMVTLEVGRNEMFVARRLARFVISSVGSFEFFYELN
jgi:hypothetical protein